MNECLNCSHYICVKKSKQHGIMDCSIDEYDCEFQGEPDDCEMYSEEVVDIEPDPDVEWKIMNGE